MAGRRTVLKNDLKRLFEVEVEEARLQKATGNMVAMFKHILDVAKRDPTIITDAEKQKVEDIIAALERDLTAAEQLTSNLAQHLNHAWEVAQKNRHRNRI